MLLLCSLALASPYDLAEQAVAESPTLVALQARVDSLSALAEVADLWPDPMLAAEYSNMAVSAPLPANHMMSGVQLKATQTLPTPGVTGLRADVAHGRVEVQGQATAEAELQLRRTVHVTWWRLMLSRQLAEVTAAHLDRTNELLDAVRSRYETGSAGQSALLRLQLLAERLDDDLGDYRRAELELTAALTQALSGPVDIQATTPLSPLAVTGDVPTWLAQAAETRPELERLELLAQNEERAAELARVDARPDVSVWAGYRVRTHASDPTDLVSVGVGMPIPMHASKRGQGMESAHLSAASGARAQHQAALDALEAQLTTALARWDRAASKATTYETVLVPSAQATLDATLSDFRVGKADFASLYDAEVALLSLERMRLTAAAETHIQHAEITALVGGTP
ncbi:MAG: TolC family protein [Proteobacteria bacterium]|nr:TolC family protein [Pseudomonadota bacterium]